MHLNYRRFRRWLPALGAGLILIQLSGLAWGKSRFDLWVINDRTQAPDFTRRVRKFLNNHVDSKVFKEMNALFDAIDCEFPTDLLKAMAWQESRWQQFNPDGTVTKGINYRKNRRKHMIVDSVDYGVMQINNRRSSLDPLHWDFNRIKTDPYYNVMAGIEVLRHKLAYAKKLQKSADWPAIEKAYHLQGYTTLDIALKAYNGMRYSSEYVDAIHHARLIRPWENAGMMAATSKYKPAARLAPVTIRPDRQFQKLRQKASDQILTRPVFLGNHDLK